MFLGPLQPKSRLRVLSLTLSFQLTSLSKLKGQMSFLPHNPLYMHAMVFLVLILPKEHFNVTKALTHIGKFNEKLQSRFSLAKFTLSSASSHYFEASSTAYYAPYHTPLDDLRFNHDSDLLLKAEFSFKPSSMLLFQMSYGVPSSKPKRALATSSVQAVVEEVVQAVVEKVVEVIATQLVKDILALIDEEPQEVLSKLLWELCAFIEIPFSAQFDYFFIQLLIKVLVIDLMKLKLPENLQIQVTGKHTYIQALMKQHEAIQPTIVDHKQNQKRKDGFGERVITIDKELLTSYIH
ncbi:hypothetical protein RIF29_10698 [Crotalaria pallida]|uniref:Uncharacterized protein n=1 Tax=Crotalaria pallida TaxID=3830 RepID=A0AAN9ILS3_CROPI